MNVLVTVLDGFGADYAKEIVENVSEFYVTGGVLYLDNDEEEHVGVYSNGQWVSAVKADDVEQGDSDSSDEEDDPDYVNYEREFADLYTNNSEEFYESPVTNFTNITNVLDVDKFVDSIKEKYKQANDTWVNFLSDYFGGLK